MNDYELKKLAARMLPEVIEVCYLKENCEKFIWKRDGQALRDTEMLDIAQRIIKTMTDHEYFRYSQTIQSISAHRLSVHLQSQRGTMWQMQIEAAAKVKGLL